MSSIVQHLRKSLDPKAMRASVDAYLRELDGQRPWYPKVHAHVQRTIMAHWHLRTYRESRLRPIVRRNV